MTKKLENLGYANGWKETPEIVNKCQELGHKEKETNIGRCHWQYSCEKCGYFYKVDTSD